MAGYCMQVGLTCVKKDDYRGHQNSVPNIGTCLGPQRIFLGDVDDNASIWFRYIPGHGLDHSYIFSNFKNKPYSLIVYIHVRIPKLACVRKTKS